MLSISRLPPPSELGAFVRAVGPKVERNQKPMRSGQAAVTARYEGSSFIDGMLEARFPFGKRSKGIPSVVPECRTPCRAAPTREARMLARPARHANEETRGNSPAAGARSEAGAPLVALEERGRTRLTCEPAG